MWTKLVLGYGTVAVVTLVVKSHECIDMYTGEVSKSIFFTL